MPLLPILMAVAPARAWLWTLLRNGGYCKPDLQPGPLPAVGLTCECSLWHGRTAVSQIHSVSSAARIQLELVQAGRPKACPCRARRPFGCHKSRSVLSAVELETAEGKLPEESLPMLSIAAVRCGEQSKAKRRSLLNVAPRNP